MILFIFLIFLTVGDGFIANTHAAQVPCYFPPTKLFFANGMFNSLGEAASSKRRLEKIFGDEFSAYDLAYNTNGPLLIQLLQVLDQKSAALTDKFWLILNDFSQAPADVIQQIAVILREKAIAKQYVKDVDLRIDVQKFKDTIESGENVLVVAHSQGNFYAGFSFDLVSDSVKDFDASKFKIVSVANPDDRVEGGGPYTTLKSDWVIRAIPTALKANISNKVSGLFNGWVFTLLITY